MTIAEISFLLACGAIGGAWNAIAGGATLFTFPALMAVGLPPVVANATNYLALLPSNAAALPAYWKELQAVGKDLLPLIIASGLGAAVGALLLMRSDPEFFVALIPYLILLATALFAFGKRIHHWLVALAGERTSRKLIYAALFVFSIYGGYFGAGLGIILLAIAQIMGYTDFHVANGVKNLLATCFTIIGIIIFGVGGLISWPAAIAMMLGSTIGGYAGGKYAKFVNEQYLHYAVIVFGLILSAVYFYRSIA